MGSFEINPPCLLNFICQISPCCCLFRHNWNYLSGMLQPTPLPPLTLYIFTDIFIQVIICFTTDEQTAAIIHFLLNALPINISTRLCMGMYE